MNRDRVRRIALHAYPRDLRVVRGAEILGMLLDAGGQSNFAFAREIGSLLVGGARERAALTAQVGTRRLIAEGCWLAAVIWSALLAWWLTPKLGSLPWIDLLETGSAWGVLAFALAGYDRLAGVLGVSGIALAITYDILNRLPSSTFTPGSSLASAELDLSRFIIPLACFAVMWACAPRAHNHNTRSLLWIVVPVLLTLILPPSRTLNAMDLLIVVSAYGLVRLAVDPRLAVACCLLWTSSILTDIAASTVYSGHWTNWTPWIAAPAILAGGATRLGLLHRSAPR